MRTSVLIAASVVLHVAGFTMISRKANEIKKTQTVIEVVEKQKKEEEKKAEEPPKPIEAAAEVLRPKQLARSPEPAPAPASAEPAPANDAPSPRMQALPDVGAQSAGGGGVPGGSGSLPTGGGGRGGNGGGKPVEKTLGNPKPASTVNPDLAEEIAAWKPKPVARVKPVYPDDARSAEIEGTVTVEVVVDCAGKVVSAQVTKGLGHGLDEAALTAIKKTEFAPAPRCAPGLQKSMKINYAFRLGD